MNEIVVTFPARAEFEATRRVLERVQLPFAVLSPDPGYSLVGCPSLVLDLSAWAEVQAVRGNLLCSGWVDYRPPQIAVPSAPPLAYQEDVFGRAAVMVLAPCVADSGKVRLVAHITGDVAETMPYLNALLSGAFYNPGAQILTYRDEHRLVSLYPRRIAIAKADDLVDGWRTLESIRCQVNEIWALRSEIAPCFEIRKRPSFLEIYQRLPRTNCGLCGERTCLAFAARVWQGEQKLRGCMPVLEGDYGHLKGALLEIAKGLGGE